MTLCPFDNTELPTLPDPGDNGAVAEGSLVEACETLVGLGIGARAWPPQLKRHKEKMKSRKRGRRRGDSGQSQEED